MRDEEGEEFEDDEVNDENYDIDPAAYDQAYTQRILT